MSTFTMKTQDVKNIDEVRKHLQWYKDYTLQELIQHSPMLEDPGTSVLGKSSRLKIKPEGSSHTLVLNNQTTWCQFQEDHNLLH
jgi:hypothetical protein